MEALLPDLAIIGLPIVALALWGMLVVRRARLGQFLLLALSFWAVMLVLIQSDGLHRWPTITLGDVVAAGVLAAGAVVFAWGSWRSALRR